MQCKTAWNMDIVGVTIHLDNTHHVEKYVVFVEKRITSKKYTEAAQNQADKRCKKAGPCLRYNKLGKRACRTLDYENDRLIDIGM